MDIVVIVINITESHSKVHDVPDYTYCGDVYNVLVRVPLSTSSCKGCPITNWRILTSAKGRLSWSYPGVGRESCYWGMFLGLQPQRGNAWAALISVIKVCRRGRTIGTRRSWGAHVAPYRTHTTHATDAHVHHPSSHLVARWRETRRLRCHNGWQMVHAVDLPWEWFGWERGGNFGRPVVVRVVARVERVVHRLHETI